MAQSTIMAAAKTAVTSSAVVIPQGVTYTFAIFTDAAAGIPSNEGVGIYLDTPSLDTLVASLTPANPSASIVGPAEILFKRPVTTTNVGVVQYA